MIAFVKFTCFIVVALVVESHSESRRGGAAHEAYFKNLKECSDKEGANHCELKKLFLNCSAVADTKVKHVVECLFLKANVMDKSGVLNVTTYEAVTKAQGNEASWSEIKENCVVFKEENAYEMAYKVHCCSLGYIQKNKKEEC